MYKNILFSIILACALLTGPQAQAEQRPDKIHVFVTISPYTFFVEKIAGANATVDVLVPQGQSPHSYEPTPKQIARLATAEIYFRAGINFESPLMTKLGSINKNLKIVDMRDGIKQRDTDPHIWLSPKLAGVQCRTIADAMCETDSNRCEEYMRNLDSLLLALRKVDMRIAKSFAHLKGKRLYVFHPAFGYFADAYGLEQVAVEVEGKEPSARKLAEIIDKVKEDGVKVIFVEPQFSAKSARVIADAIGGTVVKIDPLERDYLKNMENIAGKIEKVLK